MPYAASTGVTIYQAVNLLNGKRYIGITTCNLKKRINEHACASNRQRSMLTRAIKKYGREFFRFTVLKIVPDVETACSEERRLIDCLLPQYNLNAGGEGNWGHRHSEKTRAKMRANRAANPDFKPRLGIKRPGSGKKGAETRKKNGTIVRAWLGKKRSPETIEKIRLSKVGRKRGYTPEHALEVFRNNMRRAAANRRKPVKCLIDGRIFASCRDASDHYGFSPTGVAGVASGRRSSIYGFKFQYAVLPI